MNTLNQIIEAIDNRNILEFDYDGHFRIVEPHTAGVSKKGKDTLAAFQIAGESNRVQVPDWGQFSIDKIENLNVLDSTFEGERPGYTRGDSRMVEIYVEL